MLLLLTPSLCLSQESVKREYAIKAAFLYRIARYVEWPAGAQAGDFVFGVIGSNPFGHTLRRIARRKTVAGRAVRVRYYPTLGDLDHCDALYVSAEASGQLNQILKKIGRDHTLIVTDSDGLAVAGAAINFFIDRGHVRFEVNIEAARRAGLRISARLLRLARIVEEVDRQGQD